MLKEILREIKRVILGDEKDCEKCKFEYIDETEDGSFYECNFCGNEVCIGRNGIAKQTKVTDCDYD